LFLDVVGVEHGKLGRFFKIMAAHAQDVRVCLQVNPEIAVKSVQFADGLRKIFRKKIFAVL